MYEKLFDLFSDSCQRRTVRPETNKNMNIIGFDAPTIPYCILYMLLHITVALNSRTSFSCKSDFTVSLCVCVCASTYICYDSAAPKI